MVDAPARAAHCCEQMRHQLDFRCAEHADPFDCPDALIVYAEKFDEYGLIVHDGGPSYVVIAYCPWCGARLPESQRDRWFDEIEALGLDPSDTDTLPEKYRSAAWRMPAASP
ncbi:DUF6980 family protein [Rhodoplanes sp. SY1]|uniref:DUF6980 family protein n=1 Tax=Rhodoplanes sp. SY1 TaxID=3166646 RepID=UPI0038B55B7B